MAPSPTRPGESTAAAGANSQEGKAQEGRGRIGGNQWVNFSPNLWSDDF